MSNDTENFDANDSTPSDDAKRLVERRMNPPLDPADDVPIPIAMSAAEIDERAQAVEAIRENARAPLSDSARADSARSNDERAQP